MKKPYNLAVLAMIIITIYCSIQCFFDFPTWIFTTLIGVAEVVFALYLASKDEPLTGIEDFWEKILMVCLWLSLVLTYPKIFYEAWKDREEIRKRIK